jgi:glycosyltransferase involved in cell wall biosynthesis
LFVGKLVERKKPFDLLYAYEQLKDKAGLIFVGDGKLKIDLQSYCDKKHLERVRFIGFVNQSELPKYYALSDIFVLPSSSKEVSPLVINEAMCSSLPVVVSDAVPSATDYIKNGENGYVYEFGNLSQLRDCIYTLLTNKSIRLEMGDSSLQHIVNYSNRHNTVKILEALSSIKQ